MFTLKKLVNSMAEGRITLDKTSIFKINRLDQFCFSHDIVTVLLESSGAQQTFHP